MAKITDFIKQAGDFLKASELKDNASVIIVGVAEIVHNEKYDADRLHIPVEMEKKQYIFDASRTNSRAIAEKLGEDTTAWVGKTLVLEKYKTKTSEGKMTEAINVKEVK